MTSKKPEKPRHHGNLREALIDAGIDLLQHGGLSALTLRKCAAKAGVSHAAPAHHLSGLDGLIGAIATRGFTQFSDYMLTSRAKAADSDADRLRAILNGYIEFTVDHPALFTLMFGSRIEIDPDQQLAQAAATAYQVLAETCAPFSIDPDGNPRELEILVWSLCHGYASLRLVGQVTPDGPMNDVGFSDILRRLPDIVGLSGDNPK
ncbi:MAG: WHG domain-containing protein [Paracoccaceae bacterium]|nr:WHG domain-containing protein [Paracoccaceae bacterium]